MWKKGIKIGAWLAILGVGGYVAKVWYETPAVVSITVYDRDTKQAFDASTGQPIALPAEYEYAAHIDSTSSLFQSKRIALVRVDGPRQRFPRYQFKIHDRVLRSRMSTRKLHLIKETTLFKIDLPDEYQDNSFPIEISYLEPKLTKIWTGKAGVSSGPVAWHKYTLNHSFIYLVQVKGIEVEEASWLHELVFDWDDDDRDFRPAFRLEYDVVPKTELPRNADQVWLGQRKLRTLFKGDIAFGENPKEKKHVPPVVTPAVAELLPTSSFFDDQAVNGWMATGEPKRCRDEYFTPYGVGFPDLENHTKVRVRFHVPKFPDQRTQVSLTIGNPKVIFNGVSCIPLRERVGDLLEFTLDVPNGVSATDLKLALPTGKPTLSKTLTQWQKGEPTESKFAFNILEESPIRRATMISVLHPTQDLVHLVARLRDGYEFNPGIQCLPLGQPKHEIQVSTTLPKEIKEVEVWTYPTKTYTFKNVALKPRS